MKKKTFTTFLILLAVIGINTISEGQINYVQNFETGQSGNWSSGGVDAFQVDDLDNVCNGSYATFCRTYDDEFGLLYLDIAAIPNQTNNGDSITLTYSYKAVQMAGIAELGAANAESVSFNVITSTDGFNNFETIQSFDGTNHIPSTACVTKTVRFSVPASGSFYVGFYTPDVDQTNVVYVIDDITISQDISALAIHLKSIDAQNTGNSNVVNWQMASGDDVDYFEVERSADGKNFNYLNKVERDQESLKYDFSDLNPLSGLNYYRLKMVDKTGASSYSKVVVANAISVEGNMMQVYPNPTNNNVKIKVSGTKNGTLKLMDITGKEILHRNMTNAIMDLDMSHLDAGIYFIQCINNNFNQTVKVIKQ